MKTPDSLIVVFNVNVKMIKKLLKISLAFIPALAFAQSKFDMGASMLVENYRQASLIHAASADKLAAEQASLIISVAGESALAQIEALGATVSDYSNGVALVTMPVGRIEAAAALRDVISIQTGDMQRPMMYFARTSAKAQDVLDGTGLEQAFDGSGVVTGLMDQGIDPNHVTFQNADLAQNRVKAVYTYLNSNGIPTASLTAPDEIAAFKCDASKWTHGTHVASIMAGGYKGASNYALQGQLYSGKPNPYYGLAYGSDMVMCGGNLYDNNIMDGVAKVVEYGKAQGKPTVVNLSLGSTVGPHDGTSSLCRFLAGKGEEAIIVVAAGNEGTYRCALNTNFNRLSKSVTSTISVQDYDERVRAEFWYNTSDAFDFSFLLYNASTGTTTTYKLSEIGRTHTVTTSDATFASAFNSGSTVQFYGNVDPINNRFYVRLDMTLSPKSNAYLTGVKIEGASGKKLNSTVNNGEFVTGIPLSQEGTSNGSISDMATGSNIIAVGAYTSSSSFTNLNGGRWSFEGATGNGELCAFSSYGITYDNKRLPDFCAPGSAIVAAVNNHAYVGASNEDISAKATFNGRENYWAVMQGTSMACPYVSGAVALMLQADPKLDVANIRRILTETAELPAGATSDQQLQWGAGRINVLAAVKQVLQEKASVGSIMADDDTNFIISPVDGGYNVFVAGETALTVEVCDMAGRVVATAAADGNTADIATSHLPRGIYILTAAGSNSRHSRKIAL